MESRELLEATMLDLMSQKRSCIKPFMSDLEQTNRYRHHTALPWLVMHIYAYRMYGWAYDGESE